MAPRFSLAGFIEYLGDRNYSAAGELSRVGRIVCAAGRFAGGSGAGNVNGIACSGTAHTRRDAARVCLHETTIGLVAHFVVTAVGGKRLEAAKSICTQFHLYHGVAGCGEPIAVAGMVRGLVELAGWLFALYVAATHATGAGQISGNCN